MIVGLIMGEKKKKRTGIPSRNTRINEKFFSHLFPQSVFASLFFSLASFEKIHENLSQFGKRTKRKEGGSSNLLT